MTNSRTTHLLLCAAAVLCWLALAVTACKSDPLAKLGEKLSDTEMQQLVETLNEQCPVNYEIGTATSFKQNGNTVVIDYTIDEDQLSFEKMSNDEITHAWRMMYLDCCSPNDQAFIKSVIASGYNLKCVFSGSKSGHKATIDVGNQQLKAYKPLSDEENIKTTVTVTRAMLPMPLDSVTDMVDVTLDKENLVYVYNIKEDNFDISRLENEPTFRDNIAMGITQQFSTNSSAGELFKKLCLSGRGLCYRYTGSKTSKTINIDFSNTQLRQLANNSLN